MHREALGGIAVGSRVRLWSNSTEPDNNRILYAELEAHPAGSTLSTPTECCTVDRPATSCSCQLSESEMSLMWHSQNGVYVCFTHALCKCCVHDVTDTISESLYCAGDLHRTAGFKTKAGLSAAAGDTTHAASASTPAGQCALTLPRCTVGLHAAH